MRKAAAAGLLLLAFGCATAQQDAPMPAPGTASTAPDPRIAEMQTAMTELLERIDVLNDRIARLEEGSATVTPAASQRSASAEQPADNIRAAVPSLEPQAADQPVQSAVLGARIANQYREAIVLFGRAKYLEARRGFQEVFDADSSGDLADNALFWIGETYFASADYSNAMRYYNRVVSEFSEQNKAPDALFKMAMSQEKTGDLALARTTLQQVISRYPYSSTASSAKAELQRIRF
jgi:tol-pal system protein YbgF